MTRLASWADFGTHDESAYPELWRGCVGAWAMCLGPTGLRLHDLSQYRNWGTLTNMDMTADWVVSGGRYALDLDGSNDYANCGTAFSQITRDITASCWFLPRNLSSFQSLITRWNVGPMNAAFQLLIRNTGVLVCGIMDGTNSNEDAVIGATSLTLNTWQHACVIKRGLSLEIYLNGRLDGTATAATAGIGATTANLFLGARNLSGGADLFLNGQLDSTMLHSRAISPANVQLLATRRGIAFERRKRRQVYVSPISARRRKILTGQT